MEAAAADRLHRRPSQCLRGPAAKLVRHPAAAVLTGEGGKSGLMTFAPPWQVHRSSRESAAGPPAPEEAAGAGTEVDLRIRPHHTEESLPGGTSLGAAQKHPLQVRTIFKTFLLVH